MNRSESIKELAAALVKAQAELKNPNYDAKNTHFKNKYASLAAVREAVTPALFKHGLCVSQMPITDGEKAGCVTVLMHTSGEYIEERFLIPLDKQNAHGAASCVTYARRISLQAFAGVVGDDDDDGNAAVNRPSLVSAPITPTTGAWDEVAPGRLEFCRRISDEIIEHFEADRIEDAYEAFYGNLDTKKLSNDEGHAIWSELGKYSKQRRKIKNLRDMRSGALAATA